MANYDLSSYTEIDAGFVGNSYYNSTESSNYFNRFGNVSGTSNLYTTTKIFTPSTLPVGSIVFCPEAFGYRPEAWRGDYSQASRPAESYANVLQITGDFWDGYQYRAFNIFKAGKSNLQGQFNQIFDGFRIFVPTNALTEDILVKNTNTYSAEDRALFTAKYVDFDKYDRVFVDPIIGFMKCDSYYNFQNSYVDDTAKKFVCTKGFYKENGDLPENTIIVCDSGYQWRSDCWLDHGTTTRPANVSANFTRLDASFMDNYRCRTFNFSKTNSSYVNQNAIDFANHVRIYVPNSGDVDLEKPDKSKCITFTATGTVSLSGVAASVLGNSVPMIITCTGESQNSVNVTVNGSDAGATSYTYNKSTKALSISTTGSASGYIRLEHMHCVEGQVVVIERESKVIALVGPELGLSHPACKTCLGVQHHHGMAAVHKGNLVSFVVHGQVLHIVLGREDKAFRGGAVRRNLEKVCPAEVGAGIIYCLAVVSPYNLGYPFR